jgi:hypothetical protein
VLNQRWGYDRVPFRRDLNTRFFTDVDAARI